ncbi:hypothetical protein MMC06_005307 [Schaereria dolodes]|nr:hypothetical protein [Schaereria dolodes]
MNKFFQTNYYDYKEVDSLDAMTLQERQPIIPVGRTRGNLYAFYPGGDEMLQTTDLEHKYTCKDKRHFLRDTILGINLDVEPVQASNSRSRRQLNLSEESTKSGESDDFDPSKFQIFRQLGSLVYDRKGNVKQAIEKGGEKAIKKALQKGLWASTGFAVVLDITNGKAGAVYLVYDFWPMDDVGDIHHVSNNFWGFLPDCEEDEDQFSVAKIADSIKDLGIDHQFLMNSMICHEPEIVPAVQVADGLPILRQRVV